MTRLKTATFLVLLLALPTETARAEEDSAEFARVIEVLDPARKWVVTYQGKVWACTADKTCEGIKKHSLLSPELQFKLMPELVMYVGKDEEVEQCWLMTCKDYQKCGVNSWAPGCRP